MSFQFNPENYIIGGVVGIAQAVTGHPLDTMKTRVQNSLPSGKVMSIGRLYKGIIGSSYMNITTNSFCFGFNGSIDGCSEWTSGFITGAINA